MNKNKLTTKNLEMIYGKALLLCRATRDVYLTIGDLLSIEKVWYRWENGQLQKVYIYGVDIKRTLLLGKSSGRHMTLKINDINKTWALTKEELEKKQ